MKFGKLTFIEALATRSSDGHKLALWQCDCGNMKTIAQSRVIHGYTGSCGCLVKEVSSITNKTHGMRHSREYRTWIAMLGRCNNKSHKDYPKYGAKGITVCIRWLSFAAFYSDMGTRPAGKTIDRIDGSKGYAPENCRWATPLEQARNRKNLTIVMTPLGRMPLVQYAESIGLTNEIAYMRFKRGKLDGVSHA